MVVGYHHLRKPPYIYHICGILDVKHSVNGLYMIFMTVYMYNKDHLILMIFRYDGHDIIIQHVWIVYYWFCTKRIYSFYIVCLTYQCIWYSAFDWYTLYTYLSWFTHVLPISQDGFVPICGCSGRIRLKCKLAILIINVRYLFPYTYTHVWIHDMSIILTNLLRAQHTRYNPQKRSVSKVVHDSYKHKPILFQCLLSSCNLLWHVTCIVFSKCPNLCTPQKLIFFWTPKWKNAFWKMIEN